MNLEISVNQRGNLVLVLDEPGRQELQDKLDNYGFWTAFFDLLEPFFTNGGYTPFDPSNGNPFVGLTGAPCIAEDVNTDDGGNCEIVGRYWYFPNYEVSCPLEELIGNGMTVFKLVK